MKVSDLVGNSFKLKKDVRAYRGAPNSGSSVIWKAGRRTDPVYSWVKNNGEIWYMFGRQQPVYFVKHDPDALTPAAERGAAQYLSDKFGGDKGTGGGFPGLSSFGISDIQTAAKAAAGVLLLIVGIQFLSIFK